jgi:antitoxin ParD1/3/4
LTKIAKQGHSSAGGAAMATMNVSLPDPMKSWVEKQVRTGQYSNASDYVRDLIRQDQEYQDKRETLIKALIAGENSGVSERTVGDIWQDIKAHRGLDVSAFQCRPSKSHKRTIHG